MKKSNESRLPFFVFWEKITESGFPHTKLNSVGRKLVKPWNYIPLMKHLPKYVVGAGDVFVWEYSMYKSVVFRQGPTVPMYLWSGRSEGLHTTIWLLSSLLARSSPSSLVEKVVEATVYTTYIWGSSKMWRPVLWKSNFSNQCFQHADWCASYAIGLTKNHIICK